MWPVIPVYSFGNVLKQFLLKSLPFFRMFISHCTIENYLVTVHVQNIQFKFQFSELFFPVPEHLSRRLFTLPLAARILYGALSGSNLENKLCYGV